MTVATKPNPEATPDAAGVGSPLRLVISCRDQPGIVAAVRPGRAFLARVVRYLVTEAGIRQFLDIGTGIPSADNTHEAALRLVPPGLVPLGQWRPSPHEIMLRSTAHGGVGRKA